jgi:8-oxo-dGTP diphosphatase
VVGVGGVVIHEGRVLLIKRGQEPLLGRWVIPGGRVELGETLEEALVREILEETSIHARPKEILTVFDRIEKSGGEVRFHYVIVDYWCESLGGSPRAASDAAGVALASPHELAPYALPEKALEVVLEGCRRAGILRDGLGGSKIKP